MKGRRDHVSLLARSRNVIWRVLQSLFADQARANLVARQEHGTGRSMIGTVARVLLYAAAELAETHDQHTFAVPVRVMWFNMPDKPPLPTSSLSVAKLPDFAAKWTGVSHLPFSALGFAP